MTGVISRADSETTETGNLRYICHKYHTITHRTMLSSPVSLTHFEVKVGTHHAVVNQRDEKRVVVRRG